MTSSGSKSFDYPCEFLSLSESHNKDLHFLSIPTHVKETVPQLKPDAAVCSAYNVYQFPELRFPGKECVTSTPHVSKRCIQFPELSLPRKECVTSAFFTLAIDVVVLVLKDM